MSQVIQCIHLYNRKGFRMVYECDFKIKLVVIWMRKFQFSGSEYSLDLILQQKYFQLKLPKFFQDLRYEVF